MQNLRPKVSACFIALALALFSCNLDYFDGAEFRDPVFNPSVAIPIGEITYTVSELFEELNDAALQIGPNDENIVTLVYTENLTSQSADEFLDIPNQAFSDAITSSESIPAPGSPIARTLQFGEVFSFKLDTPFGEEYDSISFNSGTLEIDVNSTFDAEATLDVTISTLKSTTDQSEFSFSRTLSASSPSVNIVEPLSNYLADLTADGAGGLSTNNFIINVDVSVDIQVGTVINAGDQLTFNIGVNNIGFDTVFGDVAQQSLEVSGETINLDIFDSFDEGDFIVADPKMRLLFRNSFGVPLGVSLNNVTGSRNGTQVALTGAVTNEPQLVDAPTVTQIGQTVEDLIEVNVGNSNIQDLVSLLPTSIDIAVDVASNPTNGPDQQNFVTSNSSVAVDLEVEMPLDVVIGNLTVEDSTEFTDGQDLEDVQQMMFRVISENELPLGGSIELQFLDANNNVLHVIADRPVFSGAAVGPDGRTTTPAVNTTDITLEDADIRSIENATQVKVLATITTTDAASNVPVKFFADYELKFRLAAQITITIDSSDN